MSLLNLTFWELVSRFVEISIAYYNGLSSETHRPYNATELMLTDRENGVLLFYHLQGVISPVGCAGSIHHRSLASHPITRYRSGTDGGDWSNKHLELIPRWGEGARHQPEPTHHGINGSTGYVVGLERLRHRLGPWSFVLVWNVIVVLFS